MEEHNKFIAVVTEKIIWKGWHTKEKMLKVADNVVYNLQTIDYDIKYQHNLDKIDHYKI